MIDKILKSSFQRINFSSLFTRNITTKTQDLKSFSDWYRNLWVPRSVEAPYSHVTQIGDPVLRQEAKAVPPELVTSKEIQFLIMRMTEVLHKYNCVGLAAPQIGIPLRVIIMEFNQATKEKFSEEIFKAREMELMPLTVS